MQMLKQSTWHENLLRRGHRGKTACRQISTVEERRMKEGRTVAPNVQAEVVEARRTAGRAQGWREDGLEDRSHDEGFKPCVEKRVVWMYTCMCSASSEGDNCCMLSLAKLASQPETLHVHPKERPQSANLIQERR